GGIQRAVQVVLLHVRQQVGQQRQPLPRPGELGVRVRVGGRQRRVRGRQDAVGGLVVVDRQADLFEVVLAAHAGGGLADLLDGGQEQADEDGGNRNHRQQLDQREGVAGAQACAGHWNLLGSEFEGQRQPREDILRAALIAARRAAGSWSWPRPWR